jgi:hypothetical protein
VTLRQPSLTEESLGSSTMTVFPRDLKQEQRHAARMAVADLWLARRIRQEPATLEGPVTRCECQITWPPLHFIPPATLELALFAAIA